jgi:beta-galactosidase
VFVVRHPEWSLTLDRRTGRTRARRSQRRNAVLRARAAHGRKLTINDLGKRREGVATHWAGELLDEVAGLKTSAEKVADGIVLKVGGRFPRPGVPDQAVEGECELQARPSGAIKVSYRYVPVNAKDAMVEAGLALAVPAALSQFRWLGQGPYAGYPGKDRLNEYGVFHLNRDDLYFPGNRRGVELALLATPRGQGLLLATDESTVSVEHRGEFTLFSHLIPAPTKSSKGSSKEGKDAGENVDNKAEFSASSVKAISGRFVLVPLSADWPTPLRRWFGSPTETVEAKRPFLRVYDQ